MAKYQIFLDSAQDQYDFFNNGKRKGQYDTQAYSARKKKQDQRWNVGFNPGSHDQSEPKPSKYKQALDAKVKSKIDTGLNAIKEKAENTEEGALEKDELRDIVVDEELQNYI